MKCSKCNQETLGSDFCGHCGAPLKEKCPECGEMEKIGRKFCEKKLAESKALLQDFVDKNAQTFHYKQNPLGFYLLISLAAFFVSVLFAYLLTQFIANIDYISEEHTPLLFILSFLLAYGSFFFLSKYIAAYFDEKNMRAKRKLLAKFFLLHQDTWEFRRILNDTKKEIKLRLP